MDVHSVIERVTQTYAGARLYSDRGTVAVAFSTGDRHTIDFETAFEAKDKFSFSFRASMFHGAASRLVHFNEHRIDADGDLVRFGDPEWHEPPPKSLGSAVARMTGISFGCAHRVPHLLMPDRIGGRALFAWPELALGDPVEIDGVRHVVVEFGDRGRSGRVFIDEGSHVVRRSVDVFNDTFTTDYFAVLTPGR